MPIALLLQKQFVTLPALLAGAKALAPWTDIARVEIAVIARVRGAFMTRWFGRSLPRAGPFVQVAIANRAQLDARLAEVLSPGSTLAGAASVTTPIAALTGMVGGLWLSPLGQVIGIWQVIRRGSADLGSILFVAAGFVVWALLALAPGAVLGGLVIGGAAAGFVSLAVFREHVDAILATAASAAAAMNAATQLTGQLLGPRAQVRNPLLRRILEFGDRAGALVAQLLGAVAFAIDTVGTRLLPTVRTVLMIRLAVTTAGEALGAAAETLTAELRRLVSGDLAARPMLTWFIATVTEVAAVASEAILIGIDIAVNTVRNAKEKLAAELWAYLEKVQEFLPTLFIDHPVGKRILALTSSGEAKARAAKKPGKPGFLDVIIPAVVLPDTSKILKQASAQPIPPLDWASIEKAAARPQGFSIDRVLLEIRAYVEVARIGEQPSIFEPQRAGLVTGLAENRADLNEITAAMVEVIGGYLTPGLWQQLAPRIAPTVDGFVETVYGKVAPAARPHRPLPVLRADRPVPVRPMIRTLRVRAAGGSTGEGQSVSGRLIRRLNGQTYAVAAATWGR